MGYLDAENIKNEDFNSIVKAMIDQGEKEIEIENVHAMHNICAGIDSDVKITVKDSTGLYTGCFLDNAEIIVEGNAGWYAGDNMNSGTLIIKKNAGCNVGAYNDGGNIIIYGNTGSRVGYGMKAGTILVKGNAGRWAGQMAMGGKLIVLGEVGNKIGESMFLGKIFVRDPEASSKLGGNVEYVNLTEEEKTMLEAILVKFECDAKAEEFHVIRPVLNKEGKQEYKLFNPDLHPELAAKYQ